MLSSKRYQRKHDASTASPDAVQRVEHAPFQMQEYTYQKGLIAINANEFLLMPGRMDGFIHKYSVWEDEWTQTFKLSGNDWEYIDAFAFDQETNSLLILSRSKSQADLKTFDVQTAAIRTLHSQLDIASGRIDGFLLMEDEIHFFQKDPASHHVINVTSGMVLECQDSVMSKVMWVKNVVHSKTRNRLMVQGYSHSDLIDLPRVLGHHDGR